MIAEKNFMPIKLEAKSLPARLTSQYIFGILIRSKE
jgi:hypothetical protein